MAADEVRKLAEKTMTATKEVGEAIHGIQQGTTRNVGNVERAVTLIAEATEESSRSITEINTISEETSASMTEAATAVAWEDLIDSMRREASQTGNGGPAALPR